MHMIAAWIVAGVAVALVVALLMAGFVFALAWLHPDNHDGELFS